jgi:hypothetical protein
LKCEFQPGIHLPTPRFSLAFFSPSLKIRIVQIDHGSDVGDGAYLAREKNSQRKKLTKIKNKKIAKNFLQGDQN